MSADSDETFTHAAALEALSHLRAAWQTLENRAKEAIDGDLFGDPGALLQCYIEPSCQKISPDERGPDDSRVERVPLWHTVAELLEPAVSGEPAFLLGDAGMGKTSTLVLFRLLALTESWPASLHIALYKLGPCTLDEIAAIAEPGQTVLLLDALDEDSTAWDRVPERLEELVQGTRGFRRVIITCRTRFLPAVGRSAIERPKDIKIARLKCPKRYISPFSRDQVNAFVAKRHPQAGAEIAARLGAGAKSERPARSRRGHKPIPSLDRRPLMLSRIDDLPDTPVAEWTEHSVYRAMVDAWLGRKGSADDAGREARWAAWIALASRLHHTGPARLSHSDWASFLSEHPELGTTDGGLPHGSFGELLVTEGALRAVAAGEQPEIRATPQIIALAASWLASQPLEQRKAHSLGWLDLRGANLRGADLRAASLAGADLFLASLGGANLAGANLTGANLSGASLSDANLTGADLRDIQFSDIDLSGANLQGANLMDANFLGDVDLSGANLSGVDVSVAQFLSDADLSGADLSGANLSGIDFREIRLGGADLSRANLAGADLSRADLSGVDLSGANLHEANISGASLSGANLSGADLAGLDLAYLQLSDANLAGTNLAGANLESGNLGGSNLEGANLQGANLVEAHLNSANLQRANLQGADLRNASFSGARMRGASLEDAKMRGANLESADLDDDQRDVAKGAGAHV